MDNSVDNFVDKYGGLNLKAKTITLSDLERICKITDYNDWVLHVQSLIDNGFLVPMGKKNDTNGKYPPLRNRYRIVRPADDLTEIKKEQWNSITSVSVITELMKTRLAIYRLPPCPVKPRQL